MNGGEEQLEATKDTILFEWQAVGSDYKKSLSWYLGALFLDIVLIGYSVWQKDWFVIAIVVIVSAILFWYTRSAKSEDVNCTITPLGIHLNERFYPFAEIHSFWIVYNNNVKNLYFAFTKKYLPAIIVSIKETDPVTLRSVLLKKIPEQAKRGESLLDYITRIVGF